MEFKRFILNENSEEQAFLKEIKKNPKDIMNWLVFADWLEEHGDPRSDLIRGLAKFKKSNIPQIDPIWQRAGYDLKVALANTFPLALTAMQFSSRRNNPSLSTALEIRQTIKQINNREIRPRVGLGKLNALLRGFGLEEINGQDGNGNYRQPNQFVNPVAIYINMGDTYDTTVLYATQSGRAIITSWGDWVGRRGMRYGIE